MADQFNVVFDNRSYDLSRFLHDHPGGVNTLRKYKDKCIVAGMKKFGHSVSAYHMMADFKAEMNLTGEVTASGRIVTKEEQGTEEEIALLDDLESRLDWEQPLLRQLHKVAPHYDKWVNSAVYRKCQLFSNPILEWLTFTPWYLVPLFWIPIIIYLGYTQYVEHVVCRIPEICSQLSTWQFIYHAILGVLIWTAVEYSLHRWVFHLDPGSSTIRIQMHFLIHGLHHKMPFDDMRQVFPPVPACLLAVVLYSPIKLLLSYSLIKLFGGIIGYLCYDMIHYYVHHGSPRAGTYLYTMKRYHSNHHFVNHDKAFGISSKIWDYVFNTFVQVRKLGFNLHW